MEWLKPLGDFISSVGFPVALLCALVYGGRQIVLWFKPRAESVIDEHLCLVRDCRDALKKDDTQHEQTLRVSAHLADAVEASTPEDRRPHVKPHVEAVRREVSVKRGK